MNRPNGIFVLFACFWTVVHGEKLCGLNFCSCEKGEIRCVGTGKESLTMSPTSLSEATLTSLHMENLATVTVGKGGLLLNNDIDTLYFGNIGKLKLDEMIFGEEETETFITSFTISSSTLELESESFKNSPRCSQVMITDVEAKVIPYYGLKISADSLTIQNSNIGDLEKQSVYSDALHCNIVNNTIETVREKAIDASIRWFNFSLNTVGLMETKAISTGFLRGEFIRNVFKRMEGTPLKDIGPDPVCMPDPDSDPYAEYGDIVYNVVANPRLKFNENVFHNFNITFLEFPGAKNVPLGYLNIADNRVPCDCEQMKELAVLADYDHLQPPPDFWDYGDILFKKEFYASAICDQENGTNMRLRRFARAWLSVTELEAKCVEPSKVKQRRHPNGSDSDQELTKVTIPAPTTVKPRPKPSLRDQKKTAQSKQPQMSSSLYIILLSCAIVTLG